MDCCNYDLKQHLYAKIPSQVFRGKILIWQKVNLAVGQSVIVRCEERQLRVEKDKMGEVRG